jgi:DNA-binding response OmpR family regulator
MAKVLVVEDDEQMSSLLSRLLEMEGYECVVVPATADIPGSVSTTAPDAVLLDVFLGDQSGLDALESLQSQASTHGLPVVMMSGRDVELECVERGAFAFLLKPFVPSELLLTLRLATAPQGS